MKNVSLFTLIILVAAKIYSQDISERAPELKEVNVGDKMPDITLGAVSNNYTNGIHFSDFRGKLVILDFWSTSCATCIELFPFMDELQRRFQGEIQIILVNRFETQEQIDKKLRRFKKITLPNLPSITKADTLAQLFPHEGDPYHVWINREGIVKVKGPFLNTHNEQKIRDVLAGQAVDYLKSDLKYDESKPLHSVMNNSPSAQILFSSFFSRFTDSLASPWGEYITDKKDSITGTTRNSFLNQEIIDLYWQTIPLDIIQQWANRIIYPELRAKNGMRGRVLLFAIDSSRYTSQFLSADKINDKLFRNNRYCYEQIVPKYIPLSIRKVYMLQDLNRYFGSIYGTEATIELRKIPGYALVNISNEIDVLSRLNAMESGRLAWSLGAIFPKVLPDAEDVLLLNETCLPDSFNLALPPEIQSIDELRDSLRIYGLDIIRVERYWPILIIREKNSF